MTQQEFENLKTDMLSFVKEKKVCTKAYKALLEAENIDTMFSVMKRYWSSMIYENKEWVTAFVEKYYSLCKAEVNALSFYYNEDADKGLVFLSDSEEVEVSGDAEVYAMGTSQYKASGHVHVYAYNQSKGVINGYVKAILNDDASLEASGFTTVTANGNNSVEVNGPVTVYAGNTSQIKALSWKRIVGAGNSVITAPVKRGIELSGSSKYVKLV